MSPLPVRTIGVGVVVLAVAAAIVAGLRVAGPPARERMRRLDERRVADLQGVARAASAYWKRRQALPPSLAALERDPNAVVAVRDPESGQLYEYRTLGEREYELCATFELASDAEEPGDRPFWRHPSGRHCFALEVGPR